MDPAEVRRELGIPEGAFVVGHVGRFSPVKNHTFIVDIAADLVKQRPDAHFLLVGDGPLRPAIEEKVDALGLEVHFTFAGLRSDVPRLMKGAMDVFLFPSLFEGLPLVLVEAQAAGLQCVYSDVIPAEAVVIPALMNMAPLDETPDQWADLVLNAMNKRSLRPVDKPLMQIAGSQYDVNGTMKLLSGIYAKSIACTAL